MSHPTHTPRRRGYALLGARIALAALFVIAFLSGVGVERQRWLEKLAKAPQECKEMAKSVAVVFDNASIHMKEKP